jgi:hypothetical protein
MPEEEEQAGGITTYGTKRLDAEARAGHVVCSWCWCSRGVEILSCVVWSAEET